MIFSINYNHCHGLVSTVNKNSTIHDMISAPSGWSHVQYIVYMYTYIIHIYISIIEELRRIFTQVGKTCFTYFTYYCIHCLYISIKMPLKWTIRSCQDLTFSSQIYLSIILFVSGRFLGQLKRQYSVRSWVGRCIFFQNMFTDIEGFRKPILTEKKTFWLQLRFQIVQLSKWNVFDGIELLL